MKICMISGAYPPMKCGVGDYTSMLCNELTLQGHEVYVITSQYDGMEVIRNVNGVNVYYIADQWKFKVYKNIKNVLDEVRPDIIHIQYPSDKYGKTFFVNLLPALLKIRYKTGIYETVHEYLNYTSKGKIKNLINYLFSSEIIVVEKRYKEAIQSFIPLISSRLKIKYIPISSNIPSANLEDQKRQAIRDRFRIGDGLFISYFGFINELKGFENLLLAIKELKTLDINFKLVCIAELTEKDNYHNEIKNKISELSIRDDIVFTGFVDDSKEVSEYLAASDLCVLPFRDGVSERNGSFLAAYVQGIPIITTAEKDNEESGVYYINKSDYRGITDNIVKISKEGIRHYNRKIINWDQITKNYLTIYKGESI